MRALFRSGADAYYAQGGQPCTVIGTERTGGVTRHRVRFDDGTEFWAEEDELLFGKVRSPSCVDPAQGALESI